MRTKSCTSEKKSTSLAGGDIGERIRGVVMVNINMPAALFTQALFTQALFRYLSTQIPTGLSLKIR